MNKTSREILLNLYEEFKQERSNLEVRLHDNELRIKNIDKSIEELKQYDDDGQMFSPRDISGVNSTKIEELKAERVTIVEDNAFIGSRLTYFKNKTEDLHNALTEAGISEKIQKENVDLSDDEGIKDNKSNILISKNRLKNIIYKLKLADKVMNTEPKKSSSEINSVIHEFSQFI